MCTSITYRFLKADRFNFFINKNYPFQLFSFNLTKNLKETRKNSILQTCKYSAKKFLNQKMSMKTTLD